VTVTRHKKLLQMVKSYGLVLRTPNEKQTLSFI